MEVQELRSRIAAGGEGWYLFCGEEDYLKRHYLAELKRAVVTDSFTEPFNYIVFDGAELDVPRLAEAVKAPPMMSERKLVVWKYADFEKMKESTRRALDELLEQRASYRYTVLVFLVAAEQLDVGTLPKKPSRLYSKYEKLLDTVVMNTSTEAQLLSWLKKHFDAEHIAVGAEALHRLTARAGHSMEVLSSEVKKLCAYLGAAGRDTLLPEDVDAVASTTFESETFALSNALLNADRAGAFAALRTLKSERAEPTVVVGMMARTYAELLSVASLLEAGRGATDIAAELKLNPYKVKLDVASVKKQGASRLRAALRALGRMDLQMKAGGARPDFSELERFVAGYLM